MAFEIAAGTFLTPNSTGNDTAVSGLSFQPKAILLWASEDDGSLADYCWCLGAATSTSAQFMIRGGAVDGASTSVVTGGMERRTDSNGRCLSNRVGSDWRYDAYFNGFNSDGFDLYYQTLSAAGKTVDVHYIALGGSDLTNAAAGGFESPASTGNTSIDVGFEPDFVLIVHDYFTAAGSHNHMTACCGAAISSSARWCVSCRDRNGQTTMSCGRNQRTSQVVEVYRETGTLENRADFVEFYSTGSGGFTLNYSTTIAGGSEAGYLALQGGQYAVGYDTQKTDETGNKSTTGVGFTPELTILGSFDNAANSSEQSHARRSWGAALSSSNRRCIWTGSEDGGSTTDCSQDSDKTKVVKMMTENSSSPTVDAAADFYSNDSDGFTLNWTSYDATAREFGYICIAAPEAGLSATAGQAEIEFTGLDATAKADVKATAGIGQVDFSPFDPSAVVDISATLAQADLEWIGLDSTATLTTVAYSALAEVEFIGLDSTAVTSATPTAGQADLEWIGLDSAAAANVLATSGQADLELIGLDSTAAANMLATSGQADLEWIGLDAQASTTLFAYSALAEVELIGLDSTAASDVVATSGQADFEFIGLDSTAGIEILATLGQAGLEWVGIDCSASTKLFAYAGQADLEFIGLDSIAAADTLATSGQAGLEWIGLDSTADLGVVPVSATAGQADFEWIGLDSTAKADTTLTSGQADLEWIGLDSTAILAGEVSTTTAQIDWIGLDCAATSDANVISDLGAIDWIALDALCRVPVSATSGQADLEWVGLDTTAVIGVSAIAGQAEIEWIALAPSALPHTAATTTIGVLEWISQDATAIADVDVVSEIANLELVGLDASALLPDEVVLTILEVPAEFKTTVEIPARF